MFFLEARAQEPLLLQRAQSENSGVLKLKLLLLIQIQNTFAQPAFWPIIISKHSPSNMMNSQINLIRSSNNFKLILIYRYFPMKFL